MQIPGYIMNYSVSAKSPTDELLTLGRFLAESGEYASTIPDERHQRIEELCRARLGEAAGELRRRGAIESEEDLFRLPVTPPPTTRGLRRLSIDGLYSLYRHYAKRHGAAGAGYVNFTYYREGAVVAELEKREADTPGGRLKKDCCLLAYQNELDYLSFVTGMPVGDRSDFTPLDPSRDYTVPEILALIDTASGFSTVYGRETLAQYADYAAGMIERSTDLQPAARLIAEIAWLNHTGKISCPARINGRLAEAVEQWERNPAAPDAEMVLPLLTLSLLTKDRSYERRAQRIVNRRYRRCMESLDDIDAAIDDIHVSAMYGTYVTRYSVRKLAARWNGLCGAAISSGARLEPPQIIRLLEAGREMRDYAPISSEFTDTLMEMLGGFAQDGDLTAELFLPRRPQPEPA